MNTLLASSVEHAPCGVPRARVAHTRLEWFVVFACALIIMTFVTPITEAWKHSTFEDYVNADRMLASSREGTRSRQIAIACLGLFGVAATASAGGKPLKLGGALGFVCVTFLAWCAASSLWSEDFGVTLRRGVTLACEVAAGVAIAKHICHRQFVWFVVICTSAWLGLGILAELWHGTFRPWEGGYRFAGVFHPNGMGANAALLSLASLYLAFSTAPRNRALIAIAAVGIVFLLLTGSRTALAAMLVASPLLCVVNLPARRVLLCALWLLAASAGVLLAMGIGLLDLSPEILALGRDVEHTSTLTGRIPLWQKLSADFVVGRPWVGHGYGAFWNEARVAEVSEVLGWAVPNAHSSYLDLVLNLGYIGAAICLPAIAWGLLKALRMESRCPHRGFGFIASLLAYCLVSGLTESYVGLTTSMSFFSVCALSLMVLHDSERLPQAVQRGGLPYFRGAWRFRDGKAGI